MSCSHVINCELFVQFALNPALYIWKDHYCEGDYASCARYQSSGAGEPVPLTLLPNGKIVSVALTGSRAGETALFNAILKNRVRMLGSLLKVGVDINAKNIEGVTPLMVGAELGFDEIVEFLLQHGADVEQKNNEGKTALDIAVAGRHDQIVSQLVQHSAKSLSPNARSASTRAR